MYNETILMNEGITLLLLLVYVGYKQSTGSGGACFSNRVGVGVGVGLLPSFMRYWECKEEEK